MDFERRRKARNLVMTLRRKRGEQATLLRQGRALEMPADIMRFTRDELRSKRYVNPLYVRPKMSQLLMMAEAIGMTAALLEANPNAPVEELGLNQVMDKYGEVGCQAVAAVASAVRHGRSPSLYKQMFVDAARLVGKPLSLVGGDV